MCVREREEWGLWGGLLIVVIYNIVSFFIKLMLKESMFVNFKLEREINVQVPKVVLYLTSFVFLH